MTRWREVLSAAVVLTFAMAIAVGVLVPLYVDEMATSLLQARYLAEAGKMVSLFPQCAAGFIADTPLTWRPAALAYSLLYDGLGPIGLRVSGVVMAAAWLLLLLWWGRQLAAPGTRSPDILVVIAAASLGVLPLTLVLARPEQWALLLVTGFMVFPAAAAAAIRRFGPLGAAGALAVFLLATSLILYLHPKAVFFLPLMLAAAWAGFGARHRLLFLLAAAFAGAAAYQTVEVAVAGTRCTDAPILASILQKQTLSLQVLRDAPAQFVADLVTNVLEAPARIAAHAVFAREYESGWLPPILGITLSKSVGAVNLLVTMAIHAIYVAGLVLPPLMLLRSRGRADGRLQRLLVAALWLGFAAHVAFFREWHFYTGALAIAIAGMLTAASVGGIRDLRGVPQLANALVIALALVAIGSTVVLVERVAPALVKVAGSTQLEQAGQPYSVNAFGYAEARQRIRALADACGLQGDGADRLVVDELTYFAFSGLRQPLHAAYLWPGGWGADLRGRELRFLAGLGSDGILARCTFLSYDVVNRSVRDANLCCVNLQEPP